MALALARFERVVQREAQQHLATRVTAIEHIGTYSCREMAAYPGWVSEHSYANAIDIRGFTLRDGRTITIGRHYGRGPELGHDPKQRFLRAIATRLYREGIFSVVLTPRFDRAHAGHLHLDLARYRVDGT